MDNESCRFAEVGHKQDGCRKLRVVHISDTHMEHDSMGHVIPPGDVIVHSGDFSKVKMRDFFNFSSDRKKSEMLRTINSFFKQLPHRYKIFVAGNHDTSLPRFSAAEIQERLPDVTYLQDSSVVCDGVKFYGSPWSNASRLINFSTAFMEDDAVLRERWAAIDRDTDVLITHAPPYGTLDYSRVLGDTPPESVCRFCGKLHPREGHAGSFTLREAVLKTIRPKLHLFGHLHTSAGLTEHDGITISNAAFEEKRKINVIDLYYT